MILFDDEIVKILILFFFGILWYLEVKFYILMMWIWFWVLVFKEIKSKEIFFKDCSFVIIYCIKDIVIGVFYFVN